jgi:hypothetical protein
VRICNIGQPVLGEIATKDGNSLSCNKFIGNLPICICLFILDLLGHKWFCAVDEKRNLTIQASGRENGSGIRRILWCAKPMRRR